MIYNGLHANMEAEELQKLFSAIEPHLRDYLQEKLRYNDGSVGLVEEAQDVLMEIEPLITTLVSVTAELHEFETE